MANFVAPKGCIICMMCKGAIPFENRNSIFFDNHLKQFHGIQFHHKLFLAMNVIDQEHQWRIIKEFKKSGNYSEFISREDNQREIVIEIDEETTNAEKPREAPTPPALNQQLETKINANVPVSSKHEEEDLHSCECGEKFTEIQEMFKCVKRHELERESRKQELEQEAQRRREEKRNKKRKLEEQNIKVDAPESQKLKLVNDFMSTEGISITFDKIDEATKYAKEKAEESVVTSKEASDNYLEKINKETELLNFNDSKVKIRNMFSCEICEETFSLKIKLNKHMKKHIISCDECGEVFKSLKEKKRHSHPAPALTLTTSVDEAQVRVTSSLSEALREALSGNKEPQAANPLEDSENSISSTSLVLQDTLDFPLSSLDEHVSEEMDEEDNSLLSLQYSEGKSYEEIRKESEYFKAFPGQMRRTTVGDQMRYTETMPDWPEGWFFRQFERPNGRKDKEFFYSPECIVFRSRRASIEYMKCMNIYGPEVLNNL